VKFSFLLFIILLSSISISAQHKNADKAVQRFIKLFNDKEFGLIYNSLSPVYQQEISKEDLNYYLKDIYGMAGKFKSATYKSLIKNTYNYFLIAVSNDVNADFEFVIDENNKLGSLNFKQIGGSGNPPEMLKIN